MKKLILILLFIVFNSNLSYSNDLEESVHINPVKNIKIIRKYDKDDLISVTEYFPYNSPDIKSITNYKDNLKN
jgi:thioredoxin-related protein